MERDTKWYSSVALAQFESFSKLAPPLTGATAQATLQNGLPGQAFRVELAERHGDAPVTYGAVVAGVGQARYPLTFKGSESVTIYPGLHPTRSDPVPCPLRQGDAVTLWLYTEEGDSAAATLVPAVHSAPGDYTGRAFQPQAFDPGVHGYTPDERLRGVCGLQVQAPQTAPLYSIAALGDSITQMGFWAEPLKHSIWQADANATLLNLGIGGNRLLRDTHIPLAPGMQMFGRAALTRFAWDVAARTGIKTLLVALGVNDISQPGDAPLSPPVEEICTLEELTAGYKRLVALAHREGLKAVGCTITPFGGYGSYNEKTATLRNQANNWIRSSGEFDAVIDFAAAVSAPESPDYLKPEYDSGDHLHPNQAGGAAMAAAVDVNALLAL